MLNVEYCSFSGVCGFFCLTSHTLQLQEVVLYILATGSVDVNARDNAGYTALHECAVRGRVNIGKHLLTYGSDVNVCSTDGIRYKLNFLTVSLILLLMLLVAFLLEKQNITRVHAASVEKHKSSDLL